MRPRAIAERFTLRRFERLSAEIGSTGFNDLQLGDERAAVRARLGRFRVFRRTPDAPETDHFLDYGVQVTYDSEARTEFIEVMAPADPALNGVRLLQRPIADVVAGLRTQGVECFEEDEGGAYVPEAGVGPFVDGGVVETASVGESGSSPNPPRPER